MSIPVSLRLCCIAAMAPALTDTTGHSRLQLPGSPPPIVNDCPNTGINGGNIGINRKTNVNGLGIASVKTVTGLITKDPPKSSRGLLKPIQGNGIDKSSSKVQKSLKQLGLPPNLPEILKQFSAKTVQHHRSDHQYPKACEKKMNQPSNGNGPNGTGKRFIKQSSIIEEKTLNGHSNNKQSEGKPTKKLQYSRTIVPNQKNNNFQQFCATSKPIEMCRTTETLATAGTNTMVATPTTSTGTTQCIEPVNLKMQASSVPVMAVKVEPKPVDLIKDTSRKQFLLERRSMFLARRLRRLQGKQLEFHGKHQLKAFVDFQHQNLQTVASKAIKPFGDLQASLFNTNDMKNLSTSNLVSLVRKLQSSHPKVSLEKRLAHKKSDEGRGVLFMEPGVSAESGRKAGLLRTNLRHWTDAVDSDATESSSGGESCEEWEDCPVMDDKQVPTPLYKRAEWKWSVDRAAIVSRWTWLQAQVSDLEYRIRQQSEIHKTIRTSKGVVTLGEVPIAQTGDAGLLNFDKRQETSPANITTLMINVSKQASKLTQSLGNCFSPLTTGLVNNITDQSLSKSLNGYVDSSQYGTSLQGSRLSCITSANIGPAGDSPGSVSFSPDLNQPLDSTCVAARCRPVRFYRKRKLLYTTGLHQVNHKAARLSSVKCQCYPPVMPCPMCGGRYNNVQRLDAEGMPIMEKVSLLDPAFHPVLSFPQEIGLPLHFEALLKSGEWQTSKQQPKITLRAIAAEKRRQKILNAQLKEQSRKNRKKLTKNAAAVLLTSAKLRSKYDGKSPHTTPKKKVRAETRLRRKELKRRRAAQLAVAALKKSGMYCQDTDGDGMGNHLATPSPLDGKDSLASRRKRFENAYDINNIVIPYSMAASTRVEKLQYKEIQTPKWREFDVTQQETVDQEEREEEEFMTDEAFSNRHEASEASERKRFRSFMTYPPVRRNRTSRESESNTLDIRLSRDSESNTLEPMSPDFNGEVGQEGQDSQIMYTAIPYTIGREEGRRRSGSVSRRSVSGDDYVHPLGESYESFKAIVEPWVEREFPLSEDTYQEMKLEQLHSGPVLRTYTRAHAVKVEEDMEFVSPDCDRIAEAPGSPCPSLESGSTLDDINDPEWNQSRGDRRSSLSMKHGKR